MDHGTQVTTVRESEMAWESTASKMHHKFTEDSGEQTKCMVKASYSGRTDEAMMEVGNTTKCTGMESLPCRTDASTKESSRLTSETAGAG